MNSKLNCIDNWSELAREAKWSASALAQKCGVSVRALERHFLKNMGKTPKVWLNEQRQQRAMELLDDGFLIKETAAFLGYNYATNFSRKFKKHWGCSPFQKQNQTSQPKRQMSQNDL